MDNANKKQYRWIYHLLLLVITGSLMASGCRSSADKHTLRQIPRSDRIPLLVLNFENATQKKHASEFNPWEFGIASMIMTDLETIGLFTIISMDRLKDVLKQQALQMTGVLDEKTAVQVGKIVAASHIVTGSFMEIDGSMRLESQIFSVENGTQIGAASVTGKTSTFFDLEKQLILQLLPSLGAVLDENETKHLARNIETKSMNASLNNYAGEIALQNAEEMKSQGNTEAFQQLLKKAEHRFQKALTYDPDYEKAKINLDRLVMGIPMTL